VRIVATDTDSPHGTNALQEGTMSRFAIIAAYGSLLYALSPITASAGELLVQPWDGDEAYLRRAGLGTDDPALVLLLKQRAGETPEPALLATLARQLGSDEFDVRQSAVGQLLTLGRNALPVLRERLNDEDVEVARLARECIQRIESTPDISHLNVVAAAVRLLGKRRSPLAIEALLHYLPYTNDPFVEEETYSTLNAQGVREGKPHPALTAALSDPKPARRAVAACILGRVGNAEHKATVRRLLADADLMVRLRAAQGLLAGRDAAGLATLAELVAEPSVAVAWQAEELLRYAAGDDSPHELVGKMSEEERTRCRAAWRRWVKEREGAINLTKVEQGPRRPGLAVLHERTGRTRPDPMAAWEDRILVVGCEGVRRCEFRLSESWNAVMWLPQGNALLWRYDGDIRQPRTVIEKHDLLGKTIWQTNLPAIRTESWHMRPDGHLLLANNSAITEINPAGAVASRKDFFPLGGISAKVSIREDGRCFVAKTVKDGTWRVEILELTPRSGELVCSSQTDARADTESLFSPLFAEPNGEFLTAIGLRDGASKGNYQMEHVAIAETGHTGWKLQEPRLIEARAPLRNGSRFMHLYEFGKRCIWEERDVDGRVVWETVGESELCSIQVIYPLVRLGFDRPRLANMDLNSLEHRISMLDHPSQLLRRRAVSVLKRQPLTEKSLHAMAAALRHEDDVVCAAAIEYIQSAGPSGIMAVKDLIRLLASQGHSSGARDALAAIGPGCIPAVLAAYEDRSWTALGRANAAVTLTRLLPTGRPEVIKAVRAALRDPDPLVREWVVSEVYQHGENAQELLPDCFRLFTDDNKKVRTAAIMYAWKLGETHGTPAIPMLLEVAKANPDIEVRVLSIEALRWIGRKHPDVVPALMSMLDRNENPRVVGAAASALWWFGPDAKPAVPLLTEVLKMDTALQGIVIHTLSGIGSGAKSAAPQLLTIVKDNKAPIDNRIAAANALREIDVQLGNDAWSTLYKAAPHRFPPQPSVLPPIAPPAAEKN
jgi:HEAT repeat protein